MSKITKIAAAVALSAVATASYAHQPFTENERTRITNFVNVGNEHTLPVAGDDFDFATPFDIQVRNAIKTQVPYPPFEIPVAFRNDAGFAVEAVLLGRDDYDVYKYTKIDAEPQIFSGYAMVPFCEYAENFQPVVAFAGPLGTVDVNGNPVFGPAPDDFPAEAAANLPEGYGVKIIQHEGSLKTRPAYYSPHAYDAWFLPQGIHDAECIEGMGDLEHTNEIREAYGEEACYTDNTVFETISIPGEYYYVVYHPDHDRPTFGLGLGKIPSDTNYKYDYSFVSGTQDSFTPADWSRVLARQGVGGNGSLHSHLCLEPNYVEFPEEEDHDHEH